MCDTHWMHWLWWCAGIVLATYHETITLFSMRIGFNYYFFYVPFFSLSLSRSIHNNTWSDEQNCVITVAATVNTNKPFYKNSMCIWYACIHITTLDYCYCVILKWLLIIEQYSQVCAYSYILDTFIHCFFFMDNGRAQKGWNNCTHTHMHAFNIKRASNNNKKTIHYTTPHNSIWCTYHIECNYRVEAHSFHDSMWRRKKNE